MSTIKLAWDNSFARRNLTGSGVYAARLLQHLREIEGLQIEVFDGWAGGAPASAVKRRLQTVGNLLWMRTSLLRSLRRGNFDLLHCPAFVAPRSAPCPLVITMHDVTYRLYPQASAWWWVRFMNATMPASARAAAAILCGSECSKHDIVQAYSLPPGRVHVVPYGVDHELLSPAAALDPAWAGPMRGDLADRVRKATDHELEQQTWLRKTDDFKEGVKAVAERRVPNFTGR